jgi:hypothetical protein
MSADTRSLVVAIISCIAVAASVPAGLWLEATLQR